MSHESAPAARFLATKTSVGHRSCHTSGDDLVVGVTTAEDDRGVKEMPGDPRNLRKVLLRDLFGSGHAKAGSNPHLK